MTKRKKRTIILLSILGTLVVTIFILGGVWMSSNILQKNLIRLMCSDTPSSVPVEYAEVCENTTLTTYVFDGQLELDVIEPLEGPSDFSPTLVVFHGGYYVGGGRHNQEPFSRLISSKGFRVINVDYSLAPEHAYPTQIIQANKALTFISKLFPNDCFVLSGDSAGAHLAAQLTAATTNSTLRQRLQITTIDQEKLVGFVGSCGFYNASTVESTGFFLIKNAMQMLLNDPHYTNNDRLIELDISSYIQHFPNSLIICGDKDPFKSQNVDFVENLKKAGINTQTYFPITQKNDLGHEFQCNFNVPESYIAIDKIVLFLLEIA